MRRPRVAARAGPRRRHPLPSADAALTAALPEPHNGADGWQGAFRVGWLDLPLLRYAIEANGGVDALALTHVDRLTTLERWQVARAYPFPLLASPGDLAAQERLTHRLAAATPELEALDPSRFPEWLEGELAVPLRLTSHGATHADKRERDPW